MSQGCLHSGKMFGKSNAPPRPLTGICSPSAVVRPIQVYRIALIVGDTTCVCRTSAMRNMSFSTLSRRAMTAQSLMNTVRARFFGWLMRAKMMPCARCRNPQRSSGKERDSLPLQQASHARWVAMTQPSELSPGPVECQQSSGQVADMLEGPCIICACRQHLRPPMAVHARGAHHDSSVHPHKCLSV